MNKEMNKDRIKQLHDALIVIKEECKSHDPQCPLSCPFTMEMWRAAALTQNHQATGILISIALLNGTLSNNRR